MQLFLSSSFSSGLSSIFFALCYYSLLFLKFEREGCTPGPPPPPGSANVTRYTYIVARQILNITMQYYNITKWFTWDLRFCISSEIFFHSIAFSDNQEPILDWILMRYKHMCRKWFKVHFLLLCHICCDTLTFS